MYIYFMSFFTKRCIYFIFILIKYNMFFVAVLDVPHYTKVIFYKRNESNENLFLFLNMNR